MRNPLTLLVPLLIPAFSQLALGQDSASAVRYECAGKRWIMARYFDSPMPHVALELSDGRKVRLDQAPSASGIRYVDPEETIEFWSKGDTATMREGDLGGDSKTTFEDCAEKSQEAPHVDSTSSSPGLGRHSLRIEA